MEVILLEKIRNLGNLGDKVSVKSGFGRNYLIPQSKAVFATAKNLEQFEKKRSEFEKKEKEALSVAEKRASKINDTKIVISAMASEEGKLYGSVGINEIKASLDEKEIEVNKNEIILSEGPFHSLGEYTVEIHVHSDVIAKLQMEITPA